MQTLSPSFFSDLERMWSSKFLDECAKLSVIKPYMDGEEIEENAADITTSYFYFVARDKLPYYLNDDTWRVGLE